MRASWIILIAFGATNLCAQSAQFYFEVSSAELSMHERKRLLFFIADSLPDQKNYRIQLTGFSDYRSDSQSNLALSEQRAAHIRAILIANGVDSSLIDPIVAKGENAADRNATLEEDLQFQRRVELKIRSSEKSTGKETHTDTLVDQKGLRFMGRYLVEDDLELRRFDTGDSIVLVRMRFYPGRHKLLPESVPTLLRLLEQLKSNPNMHIQIIGHVCCAPKTQPDGYDSDTRRYDLSYQRSLEVYQFLINNGIDANRLTYKGVGPSQKLFPLEINEKEMSGNRRVEIVVIKK